MQHRVSDDQIERVVLVRDGLGIGYPTVHIELQVLRIAQRNLHHARRQVRDRPLLRYTGLHQVQQEEPGAEHSAIEAAAGVVDAALIVRDGPLVVVRFRFPVVVEDLSQFRVASCRLDLLGRGMRVGRGVARGIGHHVQAGVGAAGGRSTVVGACSHEGSLLSSRE